MVYPAFAPRRSPPKPGLAGGRVNSRIEKTRVNPLTGLASRSVMPANHPSLLLRGLPRPRFTSDRIMGQPAHLGRFLQWRITWLAHRH